MQAPVVTILDPARPVLLPPVVSGPPRRRLPRREQALVAALVLLLVAGLSSTRAVRAQSRLAALEVTAAFGGGLVNEGAGVGGRLRLVVQGGADVDLSRVRLDNGWRALGEPVVSAGDPTRSLLLLSHDVDCRSDVRPPSSLRVTATSRGGSSRQLVVAVPGRGELVQEAELLCGDLAVGQAVVLLRSIVVRAPDGPSQLELRLVNRSTSPVTVLSASYSGLGPLAGRGLPLTLPGRRPGLLDVSQLVEHRLLLTSNLRSIDCDVSHVALDGGQRDLPPDLLDVLLQGADEQAVTRLDVQGLHAYLKADQVAACP